MDHNMVLSYHYSSWSRRWRWKNVPLLRAISMAMVLRQCDTETERIAWCSMTRASPEATERFHRPTTRFVSPWRPPGRQSTQRLCKMYPLYWLFRWPSRWGGNTMCIARWRRFVAFIKIKATKCHHRVSTCSNRHQLDMPTPISGVYFIVKLLKKSSSCPNNNRGVTHQTDEKHLNNMSEYFDGVVKIAFNRYNHSFLWHVINQ
jgi:hypothetical protein